MVVSLKANKKRIIAFLLLAAVVVLSLIHIFGSFLQNILVKILAFHRAQKAEPVRIAGETLFTFIRYTRMEGM